MKVLLVSDAGSIHTKRWASSLKDAGVDIALFSITPYADGFYEAKGIKLYTFDLFAYKKTQNLHRKSKILRITAPLKAHSAAVKCLKRILKKEKPDILHAHYATSYGLVAALAGYHPFILSVWGSDIYEFPGKSALNRMAVKFMLKRADRVLSTSMAMARETARYYRGDIGITPFGVDTDVFRPLRKQEREDKTIVFGTVKTLSWKYGIDLLLRAFASVIGRIGELLPPENRTGVRLLIAGKGADRQQLEKLADDLGISSRVAFLGEVMHEDIPGIYSGMDVAVFLSRAESFGVSAVEAMACGVPVIASDADGFREILDDGAGVIVPREDIEAAADAMLKLASDGEYRKTLAAKGRARAEDRYDWQENVRMMTDEYRNILNRMSGAGPETHKGR